MKTINFKYISLLGLLFSILLSCDKNEGKNQDTESPIISILSPMEVSALMSGDTINIQARITDNDQLHDISASITRTHNEETVEVWNYETHSHDKVYDLYGWYVIEVPGMHNDFTLSVKASDHNGNEKTERIHFHVME